MRKIRMTVAGVLLLGMFACATNTQTGALIGGAGGAAAGAAIGNRAGNTAAGAILGAAIGGAAGAFIGNYMDRQAAEMERDIEGARIERVGEGIKITFDSGILFAVDQNELQMQARRNLNELARILNKYDDTMVLVEGHTDATGSESYNLALSERRAQAVINHLTAVQVEASRLTLQAYGESQPIADNATAEGRALNRRVEIAIWANDDLKAAARRQG